MQILNQLRPYLFSLASCNQKQDFLVLHRMALGICLRMSYKPNLQAMICCCSLRMAKENFQQIGC